MLEVGGSNPSDSSIFLLVFFFFFFFFHQQAVWARDLHYNGIHIMYDCLVIIIFKRFNKITVLICL